MTARVKIGKRGFATSADACSSKTKYRLTIKKIKIMTNVMVKEMSMQDMQDVYGGSPIGELAKIAWTVVKELLKDPKPIV